MISKLETQREKRQHKEKRQLPKWHIVNRSPYRIYRQCMGEETSEIRMQLSKS